MKRLIQFLALACAVPLAVLGATSDQPPRANTDVATAVKSDNATDSELIAAGKGVTVTRAQIEQLVTNLKANAAAQNQVILPERLNELKRQLLDGLIARQLLLGKATEEDKVKAKVEFLKALHQLKTNAHLTDEQFEKKLAPQLLIANQTRDQWEKQRIEDATIPIVLERELKINVTDDEAKKYYDENPAHFEEPEMVRVAHILFSTRDPDTGAELSAEKMAEKKKLAEDVLKRARAGEDFAKLAKEFSDDPAAKEKGGEITLPRGNPRIPPEFESAAFSLNTNQVSDIVTTQVGYHIIKLYQKIPAQKEPYAGLETKTALVKNDGEHATLKDLLTQQAMEKKAVEYVKQLRKDADVKILDESLKQTDTPASNSDTENPG